MLKQLNRGLPICSGVAPVQEGPAAHCQIGRIGVLRAQTLGSAGFRRGQLYVQSPRKPRDDLVLHIEQVPALAVEPVGPEMRATLGVDQLGIDADAQTGSLNAAFEDVPHAKLAADLFHVHRLALVCEGTVAGDHETTGDP